MRSVGSLTDQPQADRFAAYLDSQDIKSHVEEEQGEYVVWVSDEDKVDLAKTQFSEFVKAPDDPRYTDAIRKSSGYKRRKLEDDLARRKAQIRTRRMPRQPGIPLTIGLIAVSVWVTAMTRFGSSDIPFTRLVMMSDSKAMQQRLRNDPMPTVDDFQGWNAIPEIRSGEFWRIFTPMFLHLGVLHILFNMMWLFRLGGIIEYLKGTWYFLILVLFLNLVANFSQLFFSGPFFGGMSGVGFGLFGYIWVRSRLVPEDGFEMSSSYIFLFVAWGLICASGAAGPIANAAHFGGLAAGAFVGALPVLSLRNPD